MPPIQSEETIPLARVPDQLPNTASGNRIHPSTVHRWIKRGVRGIQLETIRIGGRRYTSVEAIHRFIEATSKHDQVRVAEANQQTSNNVRRRQRAADQAGHILNAHRRQKQPEAPRGRSE